MSIGKKLRIFADTNFGSITKLAELLGMKQSSFYKYLNDNTAPGAEILLKLKKLGCSIDWLLSEDDSSLPETFESLAQKNAELEEENERLRETLSRLAQLAKEIEVRDPSKRKIKQRK